MLGNVWEWNQDCYTDSYEGAPADGSPWENAEDSNCALRVLRGGAWFNEPQNVRSANRNRNTPDNRNNNVGFRLASPPAVKACLDQNRNSQCSRVSEARQRVSMASPSGLAG
jgi:hypothetical protein